MTVRKRTGRRARSRLLNSLLLLLVFGAIPLGSGCAGPQPPGTEAESVSSADADGLVPLYAWLQYGSSGLEARAIVDQGSPCPELEVDGATTAMQTRAAPGNGFPVTSCAAPVAVPASSISVGGTALPPPTDQPKRILVLGDTGCRIKGTWQENCDGKGTGVPWSFPAAARVAAAERPDLVVHVGDYVYREAECDATKQPGCAGSPWGDKWDTWKTDFFAPSLPLLDTAPWIVTRGNHEDCGRNHLGWLRFLDGRLLSADALTRDGCPQFSDPFKVGFEEVDFLVLNTTTDPTTPGLSPSAVERYTDEFTQAAGMVAPGRPAWTVTHRPFWALSPAWNDGKPPTKLEVTDTTLQASIAAMPGGGWPPEVEMALAGHVHLLETLSFPDGRPHQVVSGDAGTAQDPPITPELLATNPQVFVELGIGPADFHSYHDFGYVLLEPTEPGWKVTVKDLAGEVLEEFQLGG